MSPDFNQILAATVYAACVLATARPTKPGKGDAAPQEGSPGPWKPAAPWSDLTAPQQKPYLEVARFFTRFLGNPRQYDRDIMTMDLLSYLKTKEVSAPGTVARLATEVWVSFACLRAAN